MATEDPDRPKPKMSLAAKLAILFGISGAGATAWFGDRDNPSDTAVVAPPEPKKSDNGPRTPGGGPIIPGHSHTRSDPGKLDKSVFKREEEEVKSKVITFSPSDELSPDLLAKLLSRLSVRKRWTSTGGKEAPCVILDTTGVEYKSPDMLDFEKGTGPVTIVDMGAFKEGYAAYWSNSPDATDGHLKIAESDGTFSPAVFKKAGTAPSEVNKEVEARKGDVDDVKEWKIRLNDGTVMTLRIATYPSKVQIPAPEQAPAEKARGGR